MTDRLNFENPDFLVDALLRGEERAFAYLFETYYEGLFSYAARLLQHTESAHDIVSDIFVKLFENHKKLKIHTSLKPYLYKAAYNSCINEIKHRKTVDKYANTHLSDFYFNEILQTPEAELALWKEDMNTAIQSVIDKLPERCREIFLLSKQDQLSNKEIALKLNISVKTVEGQITKSLSRLKKELERLFFYLYFIFLYLM